MLFFFFKQKTAYEMRISDWSSDVCSSDLAPRILHQGPNRGSMRRQRVETSHQKIEEPVAAPLRSEFIAFARQNRRVDARAEGRHDRALVGKDRVEGRQRHSRRRSDLGERDVPQAPLGDETERRVDDRVAPCGLVPAGSRTPRGFRGLGHAVLPPCRTAERLPAIRTLSYR